MKSGVACPRAVRSWKSHRRPPKRCNSEQSCNIYVLETQHDTEWCSGTVGKELVHVAKVVWFDPNFCFAEDCNITAMGMEGWKFDVILSPENSFSLEKHPNGL